MTKIKICGLKRIEDIEATNESHPDYIGFVFAKSKRQVTAEEAATLKAGLDKDILAVGVFVNEAIDMILSLCEKGTIDLIQLHGEEDAQYIKALKARTTCPVIKAVRVRQVEDVLNGMALPCDYLLLDAYHEKEYGGSGISFDWALVPAINKPYFLAGGVNQENAKKAIQMCHPYGIDVSSGVETDGVKDPVKMKELVRSVRA